MSGVAGLSWELLWQHHAALAVGVSAQATAIVLACTMAGMAVGAALMGRWLSGRAVVIPLHVYGALEVVIGLSGLLLAPGFSALEAVDIRVYQAAPAALPLVQGLCIALILGPPTLAMGATIPVFVLLARRFATRISMLYGLNTAGAALGVLGAAFALIPTLGVGLTERLVVVVNLAVAAGAFLLVRRAPSEDPGAASAPAAAIAGIPLRTARWVALVTGLVTFALEVAWFRSLRAAFQSTADSFALILASVLIPLALGARLAPRLPRGPGVLRWLLVAAGALILAVTPIVERFDRLAPIPDAYWTMIGLRLALGLAVLGLPMLVLGTILPWLMEGFRDVRQTGQLYAVNTLGAVAGSLGGAWVLLPRLGFAPTAWICGAAVALTAVVTGARPAAMRLPLAAAALAAAVLANSGVGRLRVQGAHLTGAYTVLGSREGPDATVSVIRHASNVRELVIDGFQTSGDARTGHYMGWMGRLPMLLHGAPKRSLVICFGTGQTANAVRREGPDALDIVELDAAVLGFAPLFPVNEDVLGDPRVRVVVMDGRAWLRRTTDRYDVLTLEPMAPHFAGTNALYSEEFYRQAAARLNEGGVVAQWLPLHLVSPLDATSISRTFLAVFPDAHLWIDPVDGTGILVGRVGRPVGDGPPDLPGLSRSAVGRDLTPDQIRAGFRLAAAGLARFARFGVVITDDNQLLAYGPGRRQRWRFPSTAVVHRFNLELIDKARAGSL